ncbi:MAG: 7-cyano-7-deazaguanine synthase [Nanoarchaeota archaeon]
MKDKLAILLCSGGLDSVTTAFYAKKILKYNKIFILFFNYGQQQIIAERKASKICAKRLKADFLEFNLEILKNIPMNLDKKNKDLKVTLDDLRNTKKQSKAWYFPCRNIIFLTYAMTLAESILLKDNRKSNIFVGFKCEGKDPYPDTTINFMKQINKLSKIATEGKFKIFAPLINKDKEEIIRLGKKLDVDFKKTFSCYTGRKVHCGHCLACRLRQEGFYWANIRDPTKYQKRMPDSRIA